MFRNRTPFFPFRRKEFPTFLRSATDCLVFRGKTCRPRSLSAHGQASVHIHRLIVFAWTCVFSKQSLPSILCDHHQLKTSLSPAVVPLLPKLRGHFAEFLNHSSPDRLSILYLTTCVGLGYGPDGNIARCFSRQHRITNIPQQKGYASRLTHHAQRIYLPCGLHAYTTIHSVARLPSCVTPSLGYYQIRSHASTPTTIQKTAIRLQGG